MNIICSRIEGTMARLATEGRDLTSDRHASAHAARCERCRAAWDEYRMIVSRLSGALDAPESDDRFVQAVWAKIDAIGEKPRTSRVPAVWRPAVGLIGAACAATLIWLAMREPSPSGGPRPASSVIAAARPRADAPVVARSTEKRALPKPEGDGVARSEPTPRATARQRVLAKARETSPKVRVIIRPVRRLASTVPGTSRAAASTATSAQAQPTTWLEVARYYEQQSDSWSAALAYRRASQQAGDPSLHYAAGQASEMAGDIAGAIEDYARYLEAASPPQSDRNGQSDRRMGDPLEPERRPV